MRLSCLSATMQTALIALFLKLVRRLACVASVSVGLESKDRDFRCFARVKNGAIAKKERGEGGAEDKPLDIP